MPTLTRSLRTLSSQVLTLLLGLAGLAALGLENVSFGHEHVTEGHAHRHHYHFYFGPHEHHDADDHDDEPASPHHGHAPRRGAVTVASAPALFQPACAGVPVPPTEAWTALVLPPAPPRAARTADRQIPPRAPPLSRAVPDISA